jgi:hypothetical protein
MGKRGPASIALQVTPRELQVLGMIVEGKASKEIAVLPEPRSGDHAQLSQDHDEKARR